MTSLCVFVFPELPSFTTINLPPPYLSLAKSGTIRKHGRPAHRSPTFTYGKLPTNPLQARNSEKAQSMLFRFRAQQAASLGIIDAGRTRRPKMITEVTAIPTCEKWRGQVLKEISRKVSKIQEQSLSDFQIRDLNDEINKAMREKHMWEVQIRNSGGPNYMRGGGKVFDEDGKEIPGGGKGYRFVTSTLLGVGEAFDSQWLTRS